jgi:hypothetical protein
MITPRQFDKLVSKWGEPSYKPTFRRPACASCGRTMYFRMWHIFSDKYGYKREIHLCGRCGRKYGLDKCEWQDKKQYES